MRSLCLLPLALPVLLAGCDDHLFPDVGANSATTYDADWNGVQNLMDDHCVTCHSTTVPILPDAIEADVLAGDEAWVTPGDPNASELYLVLVDQSAQSPSMPLGSDLLPETATNAVFTWITDGAPLQ